MEPRTDEVSLLMPKIVGMTIEKHSDSTRVQEPEVSSTARSPEAEKISGSQLPTQETTTEDKR